MKRKIYNIVYSISITMIISIFLIFPNLADEIQMLLGAAAIILTSIFTYSNREVLRKRRNS